MKVRAIRTFTAQGGQVEAGTVLTIPDHLLSALEGLVEPVEARTWIENGELRVAGVVADLAGEIVELTGNDLHLQRRLLTEHCQAYGPAHMWSMVEAWEERAAIMEHDGGLTREKAEVEAAKLYNLTAWLPELRHGTMH